MAKVGTLTVDIKPGEALRALAEANKTMDAMLVKIGDQAADIKFLVDETTADRCRGARDAVNSLIQIAYGATAIEEQVFPSDASDLDACILMLDKLPPHRLTPAVHDAMYRATQYVSVKQREFGQASSLTSPRHGGRS